MHEVGTVLYVIRAVEKVCVENDLSEVGAVTLEIGEVSGILPEFLQDCWKWAVPVSYTHLDVYKRQGRPYTHSAAGSRCSTAAR